MTETGMRHRHPRLYFYGQVVGVVGYFTAAGVLVWASFLTPDWLEALFVKGANQNWNNGAGYPYANPGQYLWTEHTLFQAITIFWCLIIPISLLYGLIVSQRKQE